MTTNGHGVAAFDFATVSGCNQLDSGSAHARGSVTDLQMTDFLTLYGFLLQHPWVTRITPLCRGSVLKAQAVTIMCVRWKVFMKYPQFLVQHRICHSVTFCLLIILLRFRTVPCWLCVIYQARSSLCTTKISLGLMINAVVLLTTSRRLFGGLVIAQSSINWVRVCSLSSDSSSEVKHQILVRNWDVLIIQPTPLISGGKL